MLLLCVLLSEEFLINYYKSLILKKIDFAKCFSTWVCCCSGACTLTSNLNWVGRLGWMPRQCIDFEERYLVVPSTWACLESTLYREDGHPLHLLSDQLPCRLMILHSWSSYSNQLPFHQPSFDDAFGLSSLGFTVKVRMMGCLILVCSLQEQNWASSFLLLLCFHLKCQFDCPSKLPKSLECMNYSHPSRMLRLRVGLLGLQVSWALCLVCFQLVTEIHLLAFVSHYCSFPGLQAH